MRNFLFPRVIFLAISPFLFTACKKESSSSKSETLQATAAKNDDQGHLKQTKNYSSDALLRWMNFQKATLYGPNAGTLTGPAGVRIIGYTGIAAYESVVAGMPGYQSLHGQLNGLPALPETKPGYAYYWPECLNAAIAYLSKALFPVAPGTTLAAQNLAIDNFEAGLYNEFSNGGAAAELLDRSKIYGQSIAQVIAQWASADKAAWPADPYNPPSTTFDALTGKWIPTGTVSAIVFPYWGKTRQFVNNSLDGINRVNPYNYSSTPGSTFWNMVNASYNNSYNPNNYSSEERQKISIYFRDNPGFANGHYVNILRQVFEKAGATLDISSLTFAKVGIAMFDACIGTWQVKYDPSNFVVRPITYIKNVILGNPNSAWTSFIGTPNHPEYPSAHSTLSGAVAEVLTQQFGDNFSFTDATYSGITLAGYSGDLGSRHYNSFWDMSQEIGDSRVYGQIHYPQSCTDGKALGKKVAQNILSTVKFLKN